MFVLNTLRKRWLLSFSSPPLGEITERESRAVKVFFNSLSEISGPFVRYVCFYPILPVLHPGSSRLIPAHPGSSRLTADHLGICVRYVLPEVSCGTPCSPPPAVADPADAETHRSSGRRCKPIGAHRSPACEGNRVYPRRSSLPGVDPMRYRTQGEPC